MSRRRGKGRAWEGKIVGPAELLRDGADLDAVVDPNDAHSKKPVETFVAVPPSLQNLAEGGKAGKDKKSAVNLRDIRTQHEREKQGDR